MIPLAANSYDALPEPARDAIDAVSRFRDVPKGDRLAHQGQQSEELHQIISDEVTVLSTGREGREGRETVVMIIRAGGWVSLSAVFSGLPANADVTALTPVRVRLVPREALLKLIAAHPQIAEALLRVLSQRFSILYQIIVDRSVPTLKEPVIKTLYMQAYSRQATARLPAGHWRCAIACGVVNLPSVISHSLPRSDGIAT